MGKPLLGIFSPFQLAGLLYIGAALGVSPFVYRRINRPITSRNSKKNMYRLILAILCGGIIAPLFLLKGLKVASAASVSLWLPLELMATAVIGGIFFQDHLDLKGWFGMAGVLATSVLLCVTEPTAGIKAGMYILVACIFWGIDNNLTALIDNITPAMSTFWKGVVAGAVNLAIGLALQNYSADILMTLYALLIGAFCYGASIMLYIISAQNIGASRAQMIFASNPFFGLVIAVFFLGESISIFQGLAAGLMCVSLTVVLFSRHSHFHIHLKKIHEHSHAHDDGHHNHEHKGKPDGLVHIHKHSHIHLEHSHPHWPDLHHRHRH